MARPSKFKDLNIPLIKKLAGYGHTDEEICDIVGICRDSLIEYKKKYPAFSDTIKKSKAISDAKVIRSLYERATGYEHKEDAIFQFQGSPVIVPTVKHYPPDATSAIFWLKNRQSKDWRDRQEIEIISKVGKMADKMAAVGQKYVSPDKMKSYAEEMKSIINELD
jgi:hypothetical protein